MQLLHVWWGGFVGSVGLASFFKHITKHVFILEGVWIQPVNTGVIFRSALSWWIMHHCASAKDAQTHKIDVLFTHMHSFNFLWGHLVATTGGRCSMFSTYSVTLLSFIFTDASISPTFVCADTIHIQGTGQWTGLLLRACARRGIFWVIFQPAFCWGGTQLWGQYELYFTHRLCYLVSIPMSATIIYLYVLSLVLQVNLAIQ